MGSTNTSILDGGNPIAFTTSNPLALFTIQMLIILIVCRLVKLILSPLKQPSVISEIIGGIILGPTALGRIPGYMENIFPKDSLPFLNLMANFGLVLFLFLVGLELDPRMIRSSIRKGLFISLAGMAVPFAAGAAVSYALYNIIEPVDHRASFPVYLLFLGVAMSITAFSILARVLTELDLLKTEVGSITISAAAVDDATSWCLLALVVSLMNAGTGINALYVFLMGIGYTLILIFLIRPVFIYVLRRNGAFENGPSQFDVLLTLSLVYFSSFITDMIGIHPIFGGFITGIIMPHEGGFALHITEKIEDVVTVILLPLYFTLSGLKTQIGVLNDGVSWGMVILVIFTACIGKFSGCSIAARLSKLSWRESITIGIMMSCKGLVELIVLNIGLDAKVISQKTFVIMVLMALGTTFLNVPLISIVYPKSYYQNRSNDIEKNNPAAELDIKEVGVFNKVLVCLNKLEHVPALMTMLGFIQGNNQVQVNNAEGLPSSKTKSLSLNVTALRLIELSDRNSSIMLNADYEITMRNDPAINVFKTFGNLASIGIRTLLRVINPSDFAGAISRVSKDENADLILLPWGGSGSVVDKPSDTPLEKLFIKNNLKETTYTSAQHSSFVGEVFTLSSSRVAVLVDRGLGSASNESKKTSNISINIIPSTPHRIFLPFFGGKDDRAALEIVMLMSHQTITHITVVRYISAHDDNPREANELSLTQDTNYPGATTQYILQSSQEDEAIIKKYFGSNNSSEPKSILNVNYSEVTTDTPLITAVETLKDLSRRDLIVVGRAKLGKLSSLYGNGIKRIDNQRRKVLGDIAESILLSDSLASILVIQEKKT